jgi:hypothetical protein
LREALDKVYQAFSQVKDIDSFVQPVEFVHPDIRIVEPPNETRISVGGLPDHMGAAYSCDKPLTEIVWPSHANKIYGNYFTTALRLNLVGEDSAALYMLWARVGDTWKIVAFYTLAA